MPAVTVDDLTVLPRLRTPGLGDQPRPVWQLTTAPQGYEGEGWVLLKHEEEELKSIFTLLSQTKLAPLQ